VRNPAHRLFVQTTSQVSVFVSSTVPMEERGV
jgi:hypothetical protein